MATYSYTIMISEAFTIPNKLVNMASRNCTKNLSMQDRFNSWGMPQKKYLLMLGPQKWSCSKVQTGEKEAVGSVIWVFVTI